MKLKYFAWIKNITNTDSEEINDSSIYNVDSLKAFLCDKYPKLTSYLIEDNIIRIAINLEYTSKNEKICSKDEIALFPPVSGG
jgi:molybdopterin synthase sulfur carrier subunit